MNGKSENSEVLGKRCLQVAELAEEASGWIADDENRDKVGAEEPALGREFRRARFRTRKLAAAARRNMCVGVYGPSQAGKSYLISVLGRPRGSDLMAAFDGAERPLKYLDEINPEGQGESTGLVTRFTTAKVTAPAGFPVKVRLLSEPDIVKVLANAFAKDGDGSEPAPGPEEVERLLAAAESRAGSLGGDGAFPAEEMWDIQDYLTAQFGNSAYFASLRGYWDRTAEVVQKLDLEARTELLSVLWGRHAPLTDLYRTLASHLKDLDGDREVFVPLGALTPREVSIIDVQTLKELDGEAEGDLQPVAVRTARSASTRIPRGELTALVAEMIVPMAEVPWDFMKETDLLDFPGTRNRFTHNLQKFLVHGEAPLAQLFLRGKVAFLFDRYVAEQEMTSMVLCVGEGNMEAKDLPGLVEQWVAATHGATPQQRANARCILFFVLTKFDTLLVEAGGSGDDPATRFQRRVQNSMLEPFGKMPDAWINEWVPGEPFRNTFWLRNPTYETPVIAYGENKREIGIREDMLKRVETLREGAINAPLAGRHFADPQAAWEAAMEIDDGGVTRLAGALGAVCRQQTKLDQVSDQLEIQIGTIERPLSQFHVSTDIDRRLELKRAAADAVVDTLNECFEENRWGELMEALAIDPASVADQMARVPADVYIVADAGSSDDRQTVSGETAAPRERPGRPRPGGRPRPAGQSDRENGAPASRPASEEAAPKVRRMTMEAFQADRALTAWINGLHDLISRPEWRQRFKLTEGTASDLAGELIEASRRLDLDGQIRAALGKWNFSLHSERRAGPAATIAAEILNSFVAHLAMDLLPEDKRPIVSTGNGEDRPVFRERPGHDDVFSLGQRSRSGAEDRFVDWTFALYHTFEENARSIDGQTVDQEQNIRLGEILTGLAENRKMT